jgi:hypothetical protein
MRVWTENWIKVASITDTGATIQANARLIAAAPEMAGLVSWLADLLEETCHQTRVMSEEETDALLQARALLSRIRGDAP